MLNPTYTAKVKTGVLLMANKTPELIDVKDFAVFGFSKNQLGRQTRFKVKYERHIGNFFSMGCQSSITEDLLKFDMKFSRDGLSAMYIQGKG